MALPLLHRTTRTFLMNHLPFSLHCTHPAHMHSATLHCTLWSITPPHPTPLPHTGQHIPPQFGTPHPTQESSYAWRALIAPMGGTYTGICPHAPHRTAAGRDALRQAPQAVVPTVEPWMTVSVPVRSFSIRHSGLDVRTVPYALLLPFSCLVASS